MGKVVKPIYYVILVLTSLVLTIVVPLKLAEQTHRDYQNEQLSALKAEKGSGYLNLNDPKVREIINSWHADGKELYKQYSSLFGLLACIIALILAYFFRYASRYDPLYILVLFGLLFALGSINIEYFVLIAALSVAAYYLKARQAKLSNMGSQTH